MSMNPAPQRNLHPERSRGSGATKQGKRYRFEWSLMQLVMFGFGATVVMAWMFAFGVLVGRDLPLADRGDQSLRGQVVRFMGLPQRDTANMPDPVTTGEDPNQLLEELDYHKALTQKPEGAPETAQSKGDSGVSKKPTGKTAGGENAPKAATKAAVQGEHPPENKEEVALGHSSGGGEVHALLVASLRSQENAQKLQQQLRARGYDAQLEPLDKADSGRWYRVLVGTFKNRDEAQRFAAEFNKREKAQGMVIRITP